jgi:hypothetical protein
VIYLLPRSAPALNLGTHTKHTGAPPPAGAISKPVGPAHDALASQPTNLVAGLWVGGVLLAVRHLVALEVHARTRAKNVLLQRGAYGLQVAGGQGIRMEEC